MKKVLFSATVLKGHILKFHTPYLKLFKEKGYEVWVIASNDTYDKNVIVPFCDVYIDLPFSRNPFSKNNFIAYKKLKNIVKENKFDIVHTHTPIASVLTRLVFKKSKTKVIYTAHGFHFYKGSSILNWILFYPIEKYCSKFTDVLITINKEDYELSLNKFYCKNVYYVNGVGVDFTIRNKDDIPISFINDNDFVIVSIGELNQNKNHIVILEAMKQLKDIKNIKYLIVGDGKLFSFYTDYIEKNGLIDKVYLLGFRNDIFNILKKSDLFIFPSIREGLPVSIMEAMECGLPCVVSNIRGNKDLIENEKNGFLCKNNPLDYANKIRKLYYDKDLIKFIKENNIKKSDNNKIENVIKAYEKIYDKLIKLEK